MRPEAGSASQGVAGFHGVCPLSVPTVRFPQGRLYLAMVFMCQAHMQDWGSYTQTDTLTLT